MFQAHATAAAQPVDAIFIKMGASGNQGQARSQRIWAQFEAQKRSHT
jgi:hypothetical protein